jgi:predicted MFS family arabinose efflux permease
MGLAPPGKETSCGGPQPGSAAGPRGGPARWRTFSALRHRNYRLFFFGQVTSLSGTWMQWVAQGWLVYEITRSAFALGIVGFATRLPVIFLSLIAGVLADRIEKRRILIVTQVITMVLAFILAALTLSGRVQFWHVVMLGALTGAAHSFDAPTRQSFYKELVGDEDLMNAIALNSTIFNAARLVGPALAGLLIKYIGTGGCFLINGITYLAVIAAYLQMRLPVMEKVPDRLSHWEDLKEGLAYIRNHAVVRTGVTIIAFASLFTFSYGTLLPVFADVVLRGGSGTYAGLMASVGAGALVSALGVASLGNVKRKGLLAGTGVILFPTVLILLSFSRSFGAAAVLCFLLGAVMILMTASMNTLVQTAIPDRLRGRIMSFYVLVFLGAMPLGNLMSGRIAEWLGVVSALRIGSVASLAVAAALLLRTREFARYRA